MYDFCYMCGKWFDDDDDHEIVCEGGCEIDYWEDEAIPYDLYEWDDQ